jgi:cell division septal protein FtsQ
MIAEENYKPRPEAGGKDRSFILSTSEGNSVYLLFLISILMIISGVMLLVFFFSGSEKVREIQISGLKYLKESDVLEILSIKKDIPLSGEEMDRAALNLRAHPAVDRADIKLLAGTLFVEIAEKQCVAVLRNGDVLYDLFSDMMVVSSGPTRCHGVPLITGPFSPAEDHVKSEVLKETIRGLSIMTQEKPELAHRISEIRIESRKNSMIFLSDPHLRIEYTGDLTSSLIKRMYAAVSYYEKENHTAAGWIDMSGKDAILVPGK